MSALIQLLYQTFAYPRETATSLASIRYPRQVLMIVVGFVIVLSGIIQFGLISLTPESELGTLLFPTPLATTFLMGCLVIVSIVAICFAGRMLGGTGQFPETLILMSWLQFVQAVFGGLQVLLLFASPVLIGVAQLVGIVGGIGVFYATLHFIDVLHGFKSLWAAFGTLVISLLGLGAGFAIILAAAGDVALQTGAT